MENDQVEWYTPKAAALQKFMDEVLTWIAEVPVSLEKNVLTILSVFYCLCKAQVGKWKGCSWQALEKEEAILKAKKEQLELKMEIAANTAKLSNIKKYEDLHAVMPHFRRWYEWIFGNLINRGPI